MVTTMTNFWRQKWANIEFKFSGSYVLYSIQRVHGFPSRHLSFFGGKAIFIFIAKLYFEQHRHQKSFPRFQHCCPMFSHTIERNSTQSLWSVHLKGKLVEKADNHTGLQRGSQSINSDHRKGIQNKNCF